MFRVVLVDDEPSARRGLRRMLGEFPEITIAGEAGDLVSARKLMQEVRPDAVFLDVELTNGKGFDLATDLPPETFVIVVSAYDLYAINAFDVAALDFLVKPVKPERLETAIGRLRDRLPERLSTPEKSGVPSQETASDRLQLKTSSASILVSHNAVSFLRAEGDYTRVYLENGQQHLASGLLRVFETKLPSPPFHRLDRSTIVNCAQIQRVNWQVSGRSTIHFTTNAHVVEIGRPASKRLRSILAPRAR
ncbi:response regulator transcription factor [Stappia sp. BW2]|uniref:LytR/AlgR family response regulator transcription factor n=1 Tax=Stappia sp. BW2 TaxID=2592622 RepID=UPI0011DECC98|nr:LytTR family DNA-binding domain-containing protein [Stappia sp. BW2]TYC69087.1 response regulator transcription factor [Stappia sp. BW2]